MMLMKKFVAFYHDNSSYSYKKNNLFKNGYDHLLQLDRQKFFRTWSHTKNLKKSGQGAPIVLSNVFQDPQELKEVESKRHALVDPTRPTHAR